IRAELPPASGREVSRPEWWDYIATIPEPRVVVVQDLDRHPIGSRWGGVYRAEWLDYIATIPEPRVVVVQDLDRQPIGSMWGEVNGSIHKALGCIGTVTDGGVRDLDEVRAMGFYYFASCILVSHAYIHLIDFGNPV